LAEREVARAIDQVLEEQVVGALLGVADLDLELEKLEPRRFGNFGGSCRMGFLWDAHAILSSKDSRSAALRRAGARRSSRPRARGSLPPPLAAPGERTSPGA